MRPLNPDQEENLRDQLDRRAVRARSDQTFSKSLGFASGISEEEGRKDEMGHERVE